MATALLHRIVAHPAVYDAVQKLAGCEESLRRMRPLLEDAKGGIVLDVGAGTGNGAGIVPISARYVWLDSDPRKLQGFRVRFPARRAVLGDATCMPFRDKSIDFGICAAMSHHLADTGARALFGELARLCRKGLVFVDPVEYQPSRTSRLLWKYDRGSHPRSADKLCAMISEHFDIEHQERYAIYHHYLLCRCRPKA